MAAVAERLGGGRAAAKEGGAGVLTDQPPVSRDDPDGASDEERAVRPRLDRRLLDRLLLRATVETSMMKSAGRARLHCRGDGVRIGGVDDDPWSGLREKDVRKTSHTVANVNAEPRFPVDLDRFTGVLPGRSALLLGCAAHEGSGCRWRDSRTNGHTATGLRPRARMSASAPATRRSPRPRPCSAASTSVCTSTTASWERR